MTTKKRFRRFSAQKPDFAGLSEVVGVMKNVLNSSGQVDASTLTELVDFQTDDGSFGLLDGWEIPGDARVDFHYVPTYVGTAIFMREYLSPNPLIPKELTQSVLEKALGASLGRELRGHGYDAEKELLEALNIFAQGGLSQFLVFARTICPEFHRLVWNIVDERAKILKSEGAIRGAWGEDYTQEWQTLLEEIRPCRRLYLAYGSNMSSEQMRCRCPKSKLLGPTNLENWQLEFYHFANVEELWGARTPVVVWETFKEDEEILDRCEGVPEHYFKQNLLVTVNGSQVTAMAYVMTDWKKFKEPRSRSAPDGDYLNVIRRGYAEHGFLEPNWEWD